jgi:hypothetical protein
MVAANLNAQINILKMTKNVSENNAFYGKNVERKRKSRTRTKNTESRRTFFHMSTIFLNVTKGYAFVTNCSFLH